MFSNIQVADQIAESQYTFAILFILLFFCVVSATVWLFKKIEKENEEREVKILDMHEKRELELKNLNEENKQESKEREQKLIRHLEKTMETQQEISNTNKKLQEGITSIQGQTEEIIKKLGDLKKEHSC